MTAFDIFFSIASNPLIQSAYSGCFRLEDQGVAMGVLGSADNLGGIIGPIIGGILLDRGRWKIE
jgi:MFS family permease